MEPSYRSMSFGLPTKYLMLSKITKRTQVVDQRLQACIAFFMFLSAYEISSVNLKSRKQALFREHASKLGNSIEIGRPTHGRQKDFFQRSGNIGFLQVVIRSIFSGGSTVVKFHFTNLKQRQKHFSIKTLLGKYQISKSRGLVPLYPLPTLMDRVD